MSSLKSNFYYILNGSDDLHQPKFEFDDGSNATHAAQGSHIVNSNGLTKHLYAYAMVPTNAGKNIQILDSGCTRHMFPQRGYFIPGTYKPYKQPQAVEFGDESKAEDLGYGDVRLISKVNGGLIEITLTDCLYVPTFTVSLISVHRLCRKGMEASFKSETCTVLKNRELVLQGRHRNGLYHLDTTSVIDQAQANLAVDINVMHRRMGHVAHERIQQLVSKRQLKHIDPLTGKPQFCEPCTMGKMRKLPFKSKDSYMSSRPLEIIHSDIGRPITPATREGYRYWITFIDRHTRFTWV